MKRVLAITVSVLLIATTRLFAHCQLPCGIYHDKLVFGQLQEDVQTIAKAVDEISHNKMNSPEMKNQLVRWVLNKDDYANQIATKMSEYFLQQRIKENDPDLSDKLISVHKILVLSMKAKQTVDMRIVNDLKDELTHFKQIYFGRDSVDHTDNHHIHTHQHPTPPHHH